MAKLSDKNKQLTFVPAPASPDVAGFIKETSDDVVPNGWLEANGQAVSRTTYADLFALIGTTYGVGDGSTTFNLPGGSLTNNMKNTGDAEFTGDVGIGTSAPGTNLHIDHNSGSGGIRIEDNNNRYVDLRKASTTNNFEIYNGNNASVALSVKETNANVGIGTADPAEKLEVDGNVYSSGTGYFIANNNTGGYKQKDNAGTVRTIANIGSDDRLRLFTPDGGIGLTIDESEQVGVAMTPTTKFNVYCHADRALYVGENAVSTPTSIRSGNPGASGFNRDLELQGTAVIFSTGASTGTAVSEVMRVNTAGDVGIGTGSPAKTLHVKHTSQADHIIRSEGPTLTGSNWQGFIECFSGAVQTVYLGSRSGTGVGGYVKMVAHDGVTNFIYYDASDRLMTSPSFSNVSTNGGTIVGSQSSDERLKTDVVTVPYGLTEVMQLQPIKYTMHGRTEIGFGAQTTQPIIPESVYDTGEALDSTGSTEDSPLTGDKLGMEYARLVPVLTKAIQEQQALIVDLTTRLETLEGA